MPTNKKTLIACLASRDSIIKNNELARSFECLYDQDKETLLNFHFLFCGGTFRRIFLGRDDRCEKNIAKDGQATEEVVTRKEFTESIFVIRNDVREALLNKYHVTVLPSHSQGGVTILSNLVVQRQCSIIFPFLSPLTEHWLHPENLSLLRLCDYWGVKRLMNGESVRAWFRDESIKDIGRNPQNTSPLTAIMGTSEKDLKWPRAETEQNFQWHRLKLPDRQRKATGTWYDFHDQTVALVAHDVMMEKMIDYAIRYENELSQFKRILVTGTLGHEIENSCRILKEEGKIRICLSGPRGGNIEIATEVLFNRCNVVVIFVDALNPQPHIDDIRVIYGSCMAEIYNNDVRILTNEEQARDWIENTVKRHVP